MNKSCLTGKGWCHWNTMELSAPHIITQALIPSAQLRQILPLKKKAILFDNIANGWIETLLLFQDIYFHLSTTIIVRLIGFHFYGHNLACFSILIFGHNSKVTLSEELLNLGVIFRVNSLINV